MEEAATPLPSEETTPPVTKIYFGAIRAVREFKRGLIGPPQVTYKELWMLDEKLSIAKAWSRIEFSRLYFYVQARNFLRVDCGTTGERPGEGILALSQPANVAERLRKIFHWCRVDSSAYTPAPSTEQNNSDRQGHLSRLFQGTRFVDLSCNFISAAVFFCLGHAVYQTWIFCLTRWRNSGGYS